MSFYKKQKYEDNYNKWSERSKEINISNIEEISDLEVVGYCYLCGKNFNICMNNEENTITFTDNPRMSINPDGSYKLSVEITGKCPECGHHNKFTFFLNRRLEDK